MGLLSEGSPLSWKEIKPYANHVRKHGILQFISQYNKLKDRSNDCLKWGDEVEYMIVEFDEKDKTAKLRLSAQELLVKLQNDKANASHCTWHPEYAAFMIEGTPGQPYGHRMANFNTVESNMKLRRQQVTQLLSENQSPMTLTSFPRLGCPDFTQPTLVPTPDSGYTRSLYFPDDVIYHGHPRFKTLTQNIRQRRGEKVAINIPVYRDSDTASPFLGGVNHERIEDEIDNEQSRSAKREDHVYMDAMGFGMGCCCLQMTFQACNITEARLLYDQLAPLCPILLALSAASPVYRGYLTDVDSRWNIIAESVDDRTSEERGLKPLDENQFRISKSRYDSIDSYLSPGAEAYNDIPLVYDQAIYQQLLDADIDPLLSQHIAHLFIRDPVSVFSEKLHQDDNLDLDHFENIQSTNWQTMRFKPPPVNSSIGWRVEFRPTEVQLTDFENAAYVVFVVLMTRAILTFNLNFMMPISKVDANMKVAQKRDASTKEKFSFRRNITTSTTPRSCRISETCYSECFPMMTINEIINGKGDEFPGMVPLIFQFLKNVDDLDVDSMCTITQYLHFIRDRASGKIQTTAKWMRNYIMNHPDYKNDSRVSQKINFDLLKECAAISEGRSLPEKLLGQRKHKSKTSANIPEAMQSHDRSIHNQRQASIAINNQEVKSAMINTKDEKLQQ